MVDLTIAAEAREEFGSKAAARYRDAGKTPLTIAKSGADSQHVVVAADDAAKLASHIGHVVTVDVAGAPVKVLVQKLSRHPITDVYQQVDTLDVSQDQEVSVKVRVNANTINCPGIKAGGLLEQMMRRLPIRCKASVVPESLEVDLSGLNISETLYAGTIALPEGARLEVNERAAVLTVIKTRGMRRAEALASQGGEE